MKINKLIINLYNRPSRLIHTINELRKVNLSDYIIRIEACTKNDAEKNKDQYISLKAYRNIKNTKCTTIIPNLAACACAMSHIKCWKYIVDNNITHSYIIEDDIEITNIDLFKLNIHLKKNIINLNNNNKLFISFNSNIVKLNNFPDTSIEDYSNIKKINGLLVGTHFYYINYNMAKYLLTSCINITYQIDIEIGIIALKKYYCDYIKFLNIDTKCIRQSKKFNSDIQYYMISINELNNILRFPKEVNAIIFKFIPDHLKKNKNVLNKNNRNLKNVLNDRNFIDKLSYYMYDSYMN